MRPALRPVAFAFVSFGLFAGMFAVAAVDIEHSFNLSDGGLGLVLAAGILAATVVAMVGGVITDRFGARAVLARCMFVWAVLIVIEMCAPSLAVFAPAFALGTAIGGLADVVMNVIAADALAATPGRLVRFHGLFNAGTILGAIVTGVSVRVGLSWRGAWGVAAVAFVITGVFTWRSDIPEPPHEDHPSMWRAVAGLRNEGLVVLAAVCGASAMVEGGIATWGVLYLRAHLGLGVLAGVGAYVLGASFATLARIGGGPIVGALGPRRSIMTGGGLAAGGLAAEALVRAPVVAAAGLAIAAVGISVVWPTLVAVVNNEARHPTLAIGGVTAAGYLGMVIGPPLVGLLSNVFGLRVGLIALAGVAVFVACTPAHVRARTSVT